MDPINYQVDVATPFQSAVQGYQIGSAIRDDQFKQQQQQTALAQQQKQQQVIQSLIANPKASAQEYADAALLVPSLRENFKQAWDQKNTAQQESTLRDAGQAYAAVVNGKPEIAADLLTQRADAMEAAGGPQKEIQAARTQAQVIREHPEFARTQMGLYLASVPGGDKILTSASTLGKEVRDEAKAPAELAKVQAEASEAGTKAKFAESAAVLDLQKKGWDIQKIKSDIDIAKEDNRIKAMNAAISREGNDLKRQELRLKIQDTLDKRDDKIREKTATAEAGAANIDNMLNTVERIKSNKSLDSVLGSIQGRMPAVLDDDASDAIALIETLGSQAFLAQIPNIKGMGSLSNAEGEKLQAAFQNLSRTQSETQFRANLDEASRLLKKGRAAISRNTGVPLSKPDTPAAPGARPPLASFQGQ